MSHAKQASTKRKRSTNAIPVLSAAGLSRLRFPPRTCSSNGEILPPRGLAAQRPVSRKHFTQMIAVLALTANSSAAARREAPLSTSAISR